MIGRSPRVGDLSRRGCAQHNGLLPCLHITHTFTPSPHLHPASVLQSPGFILLRDQTDGQVSFLPPDESGRLMQVRGKGEAVLGGGRKADALCR